MENYQETAYFTIFNHAKSSGVKFVIENIHKTIKRHLDYDLNFIYSSNKGKYEEKGVKIYDLPDIDYNEKIFDSRKELDAYAEKVAEKLINIFIKKKHKNIILHCHNINLTKNTYLGRAIKLISLAFQGHDDFLKKRLKEKIKTKKISIILQIHDFAEEGRPGQQYLMNNCTGKYNPDFAKEIAYPVGKNITYCTINLRDKKILEKAGIKEVFYFPNCIDCEYLTQKPFNKGLKSKIKEYAEKNDYIFEKKRKILLSPLKIIKRKNIIETILILELLNREEDKWQLLITLDAHSDEDKEYSNLIKDYIRENKTPAVIGFGYSIISPSSERSKKHLYNLRDLFSITNCIITTSVKEGFGMSYIEGWVSEIPVVARRIDYIFNDFEKMGINLNHCYNKINISNKDFKDIDFKEQINHLKFLKNKENNYEKFLQKNNQLKDFLDFIKNPDKKIINNNKNKVIKNYSLEKCSGIILKMAEKGLKEKSLAWEINHKKIIEAFGKNKK
ncbi:MAG: hypothetical protein ACQER9_01375 [Nanobdellota archaeon]